MRSRIRFGMHVAAKGVAKSCAIRPVRIDDTRWFLSERSRISVAISPEKRASGKGRVAEWAARRSSSVDDFVAAES